MTVGGFLITEAMPCAHLHAQQFSFANPNVEIATCGVGEGTNGTTELFGRNPNGFEIGEMAFVQGQQTLAIRACDFDMFDSSCQCTDYTEYNRWFQPINQIF